MLMLKMLQRITHSDVTVTVCACVGALCVHITYVPSLAARPYFSSAPAREDKVESSRVTEQSSSVTNNWLFVTDEDPQGQNVSLKSVFATQMLKKVSVQFNAIA